MNNFILNLLAAVLISSQAMASMMPGWDYKKAEKKVRVIKLELLDRQGKPTENQSVTLKCSDGSSLTAVTDGKGMVQFKKKIPQKLQCALLTADNQLIKRVDFRQFEPTTVAYLSYTALLPNQDAKKKPLIRNKYFTSRTTDVKVFLYVDYKRKKAQFKNVVLTCITESGTRKVWEDKTAFLVAQAKFKDIPYGSKCFIQVEMQKGQGMLKGMIDLTESDHTFTNELHIHINIPSGKGGGGSGDGSGDEPKYGKPPRVKTPIESQDNSTPSLQPSESNSENSEAPTEQKVQDEPCKDDIASVVTEETKAPYQIQLSNCKKKVLLPSQSVTLYDPEDDATLVLKSDASGIVNIDDTQIIPGRKYLLFLGSDAEPVATHNFLQEITFGTNDRIKPACFDIGPIQYNFPNDRYDLNPETTIIQELDTLAEAMLKYPNIRVTVEGYTDSNQTEAYNMTLSRNRSESIRNYLVQKGGITEDRIEVRYYGETRLIYKPDGTEDMPASRRVEVKPYWKE